MYVKVRGQGQPCLISISDNGYSVPLPIFDQWVGGHQLA
jgi:hypothetical protein